MTNELDDTLSGGGCLLIVVLSVWVLFLGGKAVWVNGISHYVTPVIERVWSGVK